MLSSRGRTTSAALFRGQNTVRACLSHIGSPVQACDHLGLDPRKKRIRSPPLVGPKGKGKEKRIRLQSQQQQAAAGSSSKREPVTEASSSRAIALVRQSTALTCLYSRSTVLRPLHRITRGYILLQVSPVTILGSDCLVSCTAPDPAMQVNLRQDIGPPSSFCPSKHHHFPKKKITFFPISINFQMI
jgi:hypothetical protein